MGGEPRPSEAGPRLQGEVADGFEHVAEAFAENFASRGELGAAFAAYAHGQKVVDLWGGVADPVRGTPWGRDTAVMVFSGTKAWVGLCMVVLLERGALELEAPVARYWPQFASQGKGAVLVRHVLGHLAGLPGVRAPLANEDLIDDERMASLLAEQAPQWPPGARLAYHPLTYGWLCGELVRRIDGRSIGRFLADEIAGPLGLEAWIGVPDEVHGRVARLRLGETWSAPTDVDDPVAQLVYGNPPRRFEEPLPANIPAYRAAEVPASNGIATARSLARLYACLAFGGQIDGVRVLAEESVDLGRRCLARGLDPFTSRPLAFGVAFGLQTRQMVYGPDVAAFGASGAGGSVQGAWPDDAVGFAYVMNEMRPDAGPDPRGRALLDALSFAVAAGGGRNRVDAARCRCRDARGGGCTPSSSRSGSGVG